MNKHFMYSTFRFFFVLALIVFTLVTFYYTASLTYPFIIAIVLTLIINPIVNFFEKKIRLPRSLGVILALLILVSAIVGIVTLLVTEIISGTTYFKEVIPQNMEKFSFYMEEYIFNNILPVYDRLSSIYENLDPGTKTTIMDNVKNFGTMFAQFATDMVTGVLSGLKNVIAGLPNFATVLVFSTLATFFISKDWYKLTELTKKLIPHHIVKSSQHIFKNLFRALGGFIKAQIKLISMTGLIVLIGLVILRVHYAFTIALAIAFVDLLPYLGTGLVFVPWIIYSFITGETSFAIGLAILYAVVVVQRQLIEPKILSSSIGLNPLATLVALFVGFKLFGFLGLIIGPVTLVILKTLHTAGITQMLKSFILGEEDKKHND